MLSMQGLLMASLVRELRFYMPCSIFPPLHKKKKKIKKPTIFIKCGQTEHFTQKTNCQYGLKNKTQLVLSVRDSFRLKYTNRLKVNRWKNAYCADRTIHPMITESTFFRYILGTFSRIEQRLGY